MLAPVLLLLVPFLTGLDSLSDNVLVEDGLVRRDLHAAFADAMQHPDEVWPREPYRCWYPNDVPLDKSGAFSCLAMATHTTLEAIVADKFPTCDDFVKDAIKFWISADTNVVVGGGADVEKRANASLRAHGLAAHSVGHRSVSRGAVAFDMDFLRAEKLPPAVTRAAERKGGDDGHG